MDNGENSLQILHLEDTYSDAELIARELKKSHVHATIKVVGSRAAFEEALLSFNPDLILSDHSLPAFDSVAALRISRQWNPNVPFVLVTATTSEEFAVSILQMGASDYILKHNLKRLAAAVENAVSRARLLQQKESAEEELKRSYEQVRLLASHLQQVREEERTSIAREIHDELGQQLTGIKLDVLWLSLKTATAPHEVRIKVQQLEEALNKCLKTVKRVAKDLHPAMLHKLGVVEAIRLQTKEFIERTGIQVELNLPASSLTLKEEVAVALYRIYQESLTNIARHAAASRVGCSLQFEDSHLVLLVTDNGKGFDQALVKNNHSLGLLGMSERSIMMGGTYQITTSPGNGTTVMVELPLHPEEAAYPATAMSL